MPAVPQPSETGAVAPRRHWLWGQATPLGLGVAALTLAADQLNKWWTLHVYDLGSRDTVHLTPFLDLVLVWNRGISYGLLQQNDAYGQALLIGFALFACVALVLWLARTRSSLAAASQGLIIGGALGNAIDRAVYGAVADFFSLHAFGYYWYVFNIADVAIVAGVIGLLYESFLSSHKKV
jgi:signal peptidase II